MSAMAASVDALRAPATSTAVGQLRGLTLAMLWLFTVTVPSSSGFLFADSVGTISRVVGGLAMALALPAVLVGGRRHRLLETHVLMLVLVGWMYLSMMWSIAPGLTNIARWTGIQLVILAVLVWEFAGDRRQWHGLLGAYVLGAAIGALGIIQALASGAAYGTGRFSAPGFNPGTQAHMLLLALPLATHLAWSARSRPARIAAWLFLPLAIIAILLTASRASLLILPVALAGVPLGHRASTVQRGDAAPPSLPVVVGAVAVLAAVLAVLPPETAERLGTLSSELTEGDLSGRAQLWDVSTDAIREQPLIGVGAGASRRVLQDVVGELKGTHNAYLAVTTELGMVGLVLFLLLLISAGYRAHRHAPLERVLALTTLAVVVLGMVPSHSHTEKSTWLALAFVLAPTPRGPHRRSPGGRAATRVGPPPPPGAAT